MKSSILSLILLSLILLVACEGGVDLEVDLTAPNITIEKPTQGETVAAGSTIHFEALFEDDVELTTYNITIHDNFVVEHNHGRLAIAPFSLDKSFTITGSSQEVHEDIDIAADATAGPYHFIVKAIDAAGNATDFPDGSSKELEFWVTNSEMPMVHFQDATGADVEEYEGVAGETLEFYGEIEAESGALDHVFIMVGHLEEAGEHDHDHGDRIAEGDDHIYEEEFEVEGETSVLIQDLLADASIVVSQEHLDELEEDEHLYLIVVVEDEAGNIARHSIEIHFD